MDKFLSRTTFLAAAAALILSGPAFAGETAETQPADKPLYEMTEQEVGEYLGVAQAEYPELRERVLHLARKNLGQPYEIYLLGEAPFEVYDPQPLYCLEKSDCVVYAEHTYAMALTDDWPSFFAMLQRLRYKDGEIGVATRNHYTEADWTPNNEWLVEDISAEVAGDTLETYSLKVDKARFLKNRYELDTDIPVTTHEIEWVPAEAALAGADKLQDGDMVNIVRGRNGGYWVGHVGMIGHADDGTVTMIHSTRPHVKEEPLAEYIERGLAANEKKREEGKAEFQGFRFLRLQEDALENLMALDGEDAPKVRIPGGARLTGG